jgi:antitoxin (DNA-binding transcriptional repressor) of toxin-antitoxin stability system
MHGYEFRMSTYSVAEAESNLSALIDRALDGEGVVISRDGAPVIELRPIGKTVKPVTADTLEWLAARRVKPNRSPELDSGELVSALRDEDGH